MQILMNKFCRLPVLIGLLQVNVRVGSIRLLREGNQTLLPPAVRKIQIFGDLAQPGADVAVAPKLSDALVGAEEGFRRQVLCQSAVPGQCPLVQANVLVIALVQRFQFFYLLPLLLIRRIKSGFVTKFLRF